MFDKMFLEVVKCLYFLFLIIKVLLYHFSLHSGFYDSGLLCKARPGCTRGQWWQPPACVLSYVLGVLAQ